MPALGRVRTEADLRGLDLTQPLAGLLSWDQTAELDRLAPAGFATPLGRTVPIDYDGDHPAIEVRLQEMFGVTSHPTVGADRRPVRVTLLSRHSARCKSRWTCQASGQAPMPTCARTCAASTRAIPGPKTRPRLNPRSGRNRGEPEPPDEATAASPSLLSRRRPSPPPRGMGVPPPNPRDISRQKMTANSLAIFCPQISRGV